MLTENVKDPKSSSLYEMQSFASTSKREEFHEYNHKHLKNWVMEVSNDRNNKKIVDEHNDHTSNDDGVSQIV